MHVHVCVVCVIQKIEKEYKKEYPFGYSFSFFFVLGYIQNAT